MAKRSKAQVVASAESPGGKPEKRNFNHEKFAREYADHGNATLAYSRAYPDASYNTSKNEGCVFLTKPYILDLVQRYRDADAALLNITRESLLMNIADIAKTGDEDRTRLAATHDLWEKLGFDKESGTRDRQSKLGRLSKKVRGDGTGES